MIIKNIIRILISYRFSLIKIIFFEIIYIVKGNKGNKLNFSKNNIMTDNIPCPYYFLYKIEKFLKNRNFNIFMDLGCGSGRVIDFFNKNFKSKNFIGIEYFEKQFSYCKKEFSKYENIKLIKDDFTKFDFLKYKADCFFINDPIIEESTFVNVLKKIINSNDSNSNILFIFVNCNNSVIKTIKHIQCIETYSINDRKGYSIYCTNN